MKYTIDSGELDHFWSIMVTVLSEMAASLLFYGIHISFFFFTVYTLSRRWKIPGIKPLVAASCVMATLGTIQIAVNIATAVMAVRFVQQVIRGQILDQLAPFFPLGDILDLTLVINVLVTDSFLLYRCYVIWGFQKKVLVLPVVLILSTIVMGILGLLGFADPRIACGLTIATNLVLTTLIAGRIMWIRRAASFAGLDKTLRERYTRAMGMILECGAIYCIGVITVIATRNDFTAYNVAWGVLGQLMNIIPTFTLVYVGLKNAGDSGASHGTRRTSSNQDAPICLSARAPLEPWVEPHIRKGMNGEQDCECV
ncbi:hypothetical protein B0H14DRAFT_2771848 [Mycena olivaceomarginata]|nr:hypothetical protein B0H14DRAFT_2771848 [Mycena olivaceomarginata]